jgi:hypothetical protein
VSSFRVGGIVEIEAFLNEVMGLLDASLFPEFVEPGDSLLPIEEGFEWREVRVIEEDLRDGLIGFADQGAKAFCEGLS